MKKLLPVILLSLSLFGCGAEDTDVDVDVSERTSESTSSTDIATDTTVESENGSEPTLMQKVLLNQAEFYGTVDP